MAVVRHTISQNLDNLKTCLDAQPWIDGTEIDSDVLYLLDAEGDRKIGISFQSSTGTGFKVKLADGTFYTIQNITGVTLDYVYSCASGVLFNFQGYANFVSAIITKNVLGHYALVANSQDQYAMDSAIIAISNDDETPPNVFSYTQYTRKYTTLVSFNSETGGSPVSYTPFAYYIPFKNFTGSGYRIIELDGTCYLTNGYWALRDDPYQGGGGGGDLPAGYTRLEYIVNCLDPSSSGGRSGMKLDYIPPADSLITSEIDLQYLGSSGSFFVYGVPSYPNPGYVYKMDSGYNSAGLSPTLPQDITVRHTITLATFSEDEEPGLGQCVIHVGDSEHDWGNTPIATQSIWIFRDNEYSDSSPACRLYSLKIYEDGTLVRDFVPCSNFAGKVGLYDLITQSFKSNDNWISG